MTQISEHVAQLLTEAKALIDSVTFQPPDFTHRATRERLHAILDTMATGASQTASPGGYVWVPREPTEKMIHAFHNEVGEGAFNKWDAMLAAAPAAADRAT